MIPQASRASSPSWPASGVSPDAALGDSIFLDMFEALGRPRLQTCVRQQSGEIWILLFKGPSCRSR